MKLFNPRHFLRHISLPTLREFTDAQPLGSTLAIDWTGVADALPNQICHAVAVLEAGLPDSGLPQPEREALERKVRTWYDELRRAHLMANDRSIKLFQTACARDEDALAAFALRDAREQALWMLTFRNGAFRDAEMHIAFQAQSNGKYWKKHRIQPGLDPTTDEDKLRAFGHEVAKLYKKVGGGDGTYIEVAKHPDGDSVQLSIYVEGPITALAHFSENAFKRITTRIALETALVYQPSTGFVESVVKGGAKNHGVVLELFGKHVVEQPITPEEIERPRYRLNVLRDGMMEPFEDWSQHGVDKVRLRRARFMPTEGDPVSFQIEASPEKAKDDAMVLALARLKIGHSFESEYNLVGATVVVYTLGGEERKPGQFSFDLNSTGWSTIKNLPDHNQRIALAVLQALNVIDPEPAAA